MFENAQRAENQIRPIEWGLFCAYDVTAHMPGEDHTRAGARLIQLKAGFEAGFGDVPIVVR
jgi:hypothetical protein